jgi:hypothetical protein
MQKLSIFIICLFTVIGCRSTKAGITKNYRDSIPIVAFCDLPNYKGEKVYVKGFYSGVDEYWSLNNGRAKCNEKLTVDLQFKDDPFNPPKEFESAFREVHNNYHNSYLQIEAVGTFENDRQGGYGHLGSNNSRFVVYELIEATLIRK